MGALFLLPHTAETPDEVLNIFEKKGFEAPLSLIVGSYRVLLYKKQLLSFYQKVEIGNSILLASGTCFYKNLECLEGLQNILHEYIDGTIDLKEIKGSFLLLFWHNNQLSFFSDPSGIQNIFYHEKSNIISTSFLAAIAGVSKFTGKLNLNLEAITETLLTGNLIGPETIVNSIMRFETAMHHQICDIPQLELNTISSTNSIAKNFDDAIQFQLNALDHYFENLKIPFAKYGIISGLTGGFDSRLLFLAFRKYSDNHSLYSTTRKLLTSELICAKKFAEAAGENLILPLHKAIHEHDSKTVTESIAHNFYFNDGLIRTFQLWIEEIKSREYLIQLYGNKQIGMSGVGGEAYRNSDYQFRSGFRFTNWVYAELIFKNGGNLLRNKKAKNLLTSRIEMKIKALLNISPPAKSISKVDIKRYYNEVWNASNRTVRNNIENQLAFFLSPFTDYELSKTAYSAIPFLGIAHNFEKKMIEVLAPELASISTNYGYAINRAVPYKYKGIALLKTILGFRAFNAMYFFIKNRNQTALHNLIIHHPHFQQYINTIKKLNLPIDIKKLESNDFLSPLLIETGFFINEMQDYLSHD